MLKSIYKTLIGFKNVLLTTNYAIMKVILIQFIVILGPRLELLRISSTEPKNCSSHFCGFVNQVRASSLPCNLKLLRHFIDVFRESYLNLYHKLQ